MRCEDDLSSYGRVSKMVGRETQKKIENDPWKSNMLCLQRQKKKKKKGLALAHSTLKGWKKTLILKGANLT